MIVAHLDLDAFFAAVEELENPSSGARRSSSAGTPRPWSRRDGELRGPPLRHPLGDELRGGAAPLSARSVHPGPGTRSIASTHAPCGTPCAMWCRPSSGQGSMRGIST